MSITDRNKAQGNLEWAIHRVHNTLYADKQSKNTQNNTEN